MTRIPAILLLACLATPALASGAAKMAAE